MGKETVEELHEQARRDYGTPSEREDRAADARGQLADARASASSASGAAGRRS